MYGGKDIHVNNVVFVHGSFDPWHALGVTKDLSPGIYFSKFRQNILSEVS
jgi:hypothetical protein